MTILANELEALGKRGDMGLLFRKLYNNLEEIVSALRFKDAMVDQKKDGGNERTTLAKSNSSRAGVRGKGGSGEAVRAVGSVTEK